MQKLKIIFVNHRKLEKKLRRLKGDMMQGKEELQIRLGKMHRSLSHSLQKWKQHRIAEEVEDALVFKLSNNGYHSHLLVSDLTK